MPRRIHKNASAGVFYYTCNGLCKEDAYEQGDTYGSCDRAQRKCSRQEKYAWGQGEDGGDEVGTGIAITVLDEIGEKNLGKAKGQYITIECSKLKEYEESIHEPLRAELEGRLRELMGHAGNILVVGLGNRQVTPDSIGPLVIDNLYVTRHLDTPGKPDLVMSAICPGVMAQTGIETVDIVRGICDEIDVEIVVAIDALAARSSKRLGCTIQLTDTGISPGSGVGNNRKTLSSDNLGRRVIAVGVPTVISVPSIIDDSLDEVADAFNETYGRRIMREFTEKQRYQIACNLLDEDMADMFVTPKNIDELVRRISFTISEAINAIAM